MDKEASKKYLFWVIIAAIIIISFFVLKDFIIALITAGVLAFLLRPLHLKLSKKIPEKISAFLVILLALIVIILLLGFVVVSLTEELLKIIDGNYIEQLIQKAEEITGTTLTKYLSEIGAESTNFLLKLVSSTVTKIPHMILIIFIILFATYYFVLEWEKIRKNVLRILPFKNKTKIIEEIEQATNQIVVITLFLAVIEAIIVAVGFYLLGIKFAIILGFLVGIFAFIPALGPSAIWVPTALIKFAMGDYQVALGVLAIGLIVGVFIDGLLRIKITGKKTAIHPVVVLVGIVGGIKLFGLVGFILGPLILDTLITLIQNIPNSD